MTNLFGFADSKNSGYLDLSATFDLGSGFSVVPHIGYQQVGTTTTSPTPTTRWRWTRTSDGFTLSAALVATSGAGLYRGASGKNLGKTGIVVGLKYVF